MCDPNPVVGEQVLFEINWCWFVVGVDQIERLWRGGFWDNRIAGQLNWFGHLRRGWKVSIDDNHPDASSALHELVITLQHESGAARPTIKLIENIRAWKWAGLFRLRGWHLFWRILRHLTTRRFASDENGCRNHGHE